MMSRISRAQQQRLSVVLSYTLLILLTLVFVLPIAFMLFSSVKTSDAMFSDLRSWRAFFPVGNLTMENINFVFEKGNFQRYAVNSVLITLITVTLSVGINSMAAYALARLNWRAKDMVLAGIVAILIIPFEAIAIPLLMLVSEVPGLHIGLDGIHLTDTMLNTHLVQILPFIASPFSIFLFYQFFRDLPREIDEAARMDGATPFQIFTMIVLPLSKPVIATVAILQFLAMWNQYLWPIMVVQSANARPVMPGIQEFFNRTPAWGQIMAYASLVTLPVLTVFALFQRWFVQSVASSGVKG